MATKLSQKAGGQLGKQKTKCQPLKKHISRNIKIAKVTRTLPTHGCKKVKFKNVSNESDETVTDEEKKIPENVYSQPEFHSTLMVAEKLQSLRLATFDENKAVSKKLAECEPIRKEVMHKSVKHVNIPPSVKVFPNLIPLDFNEESLLKKVAEEREVKIQRIQRKALSRDPEPLIEEFFTPDLQPEFIAIPDVKVNFHELLKPESPEITNRLYLYRQRWETMSD